MILWFILIGILMTVDKSRKKWLESTSLDLRGKLVRHEQAIKFRSRQELARIITEDVARIKSEIARNKNIVSLR